MLTDVASLASLDSDDQSAAATAIRVEALGRLIDAGAIDWAWRVFTQLEHAVVESERTRWEVDLAHYRLLSRTADESQATALADCLIERGRQTRDPWVRLQVQGLRIAAATSSSEILDLKRELKVMRAAGVVSDDAETDEMLELAARLIEEIDRDMPSPETSLDAKNLRDLLRWWSHPGALPPHVDGGDAHSVEGALHAYMGRRPGRRMQRSVGSFSDQDPSPEAARTLAASWEGATEAVIIASRLAAAMRLGDALTYIEEVESRAAADGHTRVAAIAAVLRGHVLGALGDRAGAIAGLWDGAGEFQRIGELQLAGHAFLHIGRFAALDPDGDDLIGDRVTISEGGTLSRGQRTLTILLSAKCAFEVLGDELGLAEVRLGEIVARWMAGDGWFVKRQLGELSERCWRLGPEAVVLAMEATVLHAQLLARTGEKKDLRKLLRRLRRRPEAREPFWSWQIDTVEARACLSGGDIDKATTLVWQALDTVDKLRWRVGDELQRSMWIVPRREVWEVALEAAFTRGDAMAGLMVIERGKSSSLARLLLATAAEAKAPIAPAVGRALLSRSTLSRSPLTGTALIKERQEQARSVKAEAIAAIRRSNAQLASAIDPPNFEPSMFEGLARQIGPFAFVDFLELGKGRWWVAWGTDQGPVNQHEIELNPHDQHAIDQLNSIGTGNHDVARWIMRRGEQAVRGLGAVLLPPLTEVADSTSTLLISSSGALTTVPFAALDLAPGLRVFDRFATIHIPSLTTVGALPPALPGRYAPIILACDPQGDLHSLRRQVEDLTRIWPEALVLERAEATLEALRQLSDDGRLARARSLVVAAHGAPHPDDPVASGILLGDGEVLNAGMLLGLRLPTLVEFWTCESGAERPLAGDEHLGLVTSALMAGGRQVLATTWSLADQYAPFLSATFHSALRRGMPGTSGAPRDPSGGRKQHHAVRVVGAARDPRDTMKGTVMATFLETVSRHSTRFQPAFAMITGASPATPIDIGDLNFSIQGTTRRGRQVLVPIPADDETEIARFASVTRAMATFTPEGKPPTAAEAAASVQRKICYGAAELMVTNMRLCVLLIRGETILGNVNESRGSLFALSFAYGDVDYVDVARRKGAFGAMKESDVKVVLLAPPAALVLEPGYRMDPTSDTPAKTSYSAFADTLVEAVCDFHLGIVTDEQERTRLQQVKTGYRHETGTDLTALIQRRN